MKRAIAVLSFAAALAVAAFAETGARHAKAIDCSDCCHAKCGQTCCQTGCTESGCQSE